MKKVLTFLLTLFLIGCMAPMVSAANDEATEAADALYELGLFKGTGTNPDGTPVFDLDKTPTRNQAVIMLVRLLGKEEEALAGNWNLPFTDVPKASTAYPYIGYAYANGLTNGTSATTYSGTNPIKANQYIAFVLRSLGYESGKDFEVSSSWKLSDELGLTDGQYTNYTSNTNPPAFTRGQVAIISYRSLSCVRKTPDPFANIPAETPAQARRFQQFKSQFLSKNRFPITSKGLTLTWDEARALVGYNLTVVKEHVKSLEDVLYYMVAAGYTRDGYDIELKDPAYRWSWHFCASPSLVLKTNIGNCGGTAGLVASLLEGDYDEVGMLNLYGLKSGHVTNYLKDGDTHLTFDVNKFAGGYNHSLDLSKNADLNTAALRSFGKEDGDHTYDLIFSYTGCYGGNLPSTGPKPEIYIPEGYAENINIVRESTEKGLILKPISVSPDVLNAIEIMRNLTRNALILES